MNWNLPESHRFHLPSASAPFVVRFPGDTPLARTRVAEGQKHDWPTDVSRLDVSLRTAWKSYTLILSSDAISAAILTSGMSLQRCCTQTTLLSDAPVFLFIVWQADQGSSALPMFVFDAQIYHKLCMCISNIRMTARVPLGSDEYFLQPWPCPIQTSSTNTMLWTDDECMETAIVFAKHFTALSAEVVVASGGLHFKCWEATIFVPEKNL